MATGLTVIVAKIITRGLTILAAALVGSELTPGETEALAGVSTTLAVALGAVIGELWRVWYERKQKKG